jgi:hypothetical protein
MMNMDAFRAGNQKPMDSFKRSKIGLGGGHRPILLAALVVAVGFGPSDAKARRQPVRTAVYSCGVVSGPDLTGPAGQLILNICLSVGKDGTGVGTVSDAIHPDVNAHLAVQQFAQRGSVVHFGGVVRAASDPARVGQSFDVIGVAPGRLTRLVLLLEGAEFAGRGLTIRDTTANSTNIILNDCRQLAASLAGASSGAKFDQLFNLCAADAGL